MANKETKECAESRAGVPHKEHTFGPGNKYQCWGIPEPPPRRVKKR